MEKQYSPTAKEKKVSNKQAKSAEALKPAKVEEIKAKVEESKTGEIKAKVEEIKTSEKSEDKKQEKQEKFAKELAFVRGESLRISKKYSMSICKMIKHKSPDRAIEMLEEVLKHKRAVPMNNMEIPHRKGNIMAGRYPKNASKEFIALLKQLNANASVNGVENPVIVIAKADKASRPHRREGRRAKRTHVYMEARDKTKLKLKTKR